MSNEKELITNIKWNDLNEEYPKKNKRRNIIQEMPLK